MKTLLRFVAKNATSGVIVGVFALGIFGTLAYAQGAPQVPVLTDIINTLFNKDAAGTWELKDGVVDATALAPSSTVNLSGTITGANPGEVTNTIFTSTNIADTEGSLWLRAGALPNGARNSVRIDGGFCDEAQGCNLETIGLNANYTIMSGNGLVYGALGVGGSPQDIQLLVQSNNNLDPLRLAIPDKSYRLGPNTGGVSGKGFGIYDDQNTALRFAIDGTNGNVGIGTGAPTGTLHVIDNGTGYVGKFTADRNFGAVLGLQNMNTLADSMLGAINFLDSTGSAIAQIAAQNQGKALTFNTAGTEKMRIDETGTVTATKFVGDGSGLTNLPTAANPQNISATTIHAGAPNPLDANAPFSVQGQSMFRGSVNFIGDITTTGKTYLGGGITTVAGIPLKGDNVPLNIESYGCYETTHGYFNQGAYCERSNEIVFGARNDGKVMCCKLRLAPGDPYGVDLFPGQND